VSWAELGGARNNFLGKKNFWTVLMKKDPVLCGRCFYLKTGVQPEFQRKIKAQIAGDFFQYYFCPWLFLLWFYNR